MNIPWKKTAILFTCVWIMSVGVPHAARAFQQPASQSQASWPTPEEVVKKLDAKLSLSDDQKAKITPIIADRQQKIKALAADSSGRRFQKARKMKSIYADSDKKIKALLNDDQKKKYSEMQDEMRAEMKERMQERKNSSQ